MRTIAIAAAVTALVAVAAPSLAQQIPPVVDRNAAAACKPRDVAAALVCLDQHLKPEVKQAIKNAPANNGLETQEIYVGLWIRNGWGLWSGSDLTQSMGAAGLPQVERQSERIVQAYWLREKGCTYDWNNPRLVLAAVQQARRGGDPCTATMPAAAPAGRAGTAAAARAGRAGAAAGAADAESEEEYNPNQ